MSASGNFRGSCVHYSAEWPTPTYSNKLDAYKTLGTYLVDVDMLVSQFTIFRFRMYKYHVEVIEIPLDNLCHGQ